MFKKIVWTLVILFVAYSFYLNYLENKELEERTQLFVLNEKPGLLKSMNTLISEKKYKEAIEVATSSTIPDRDLDRLANDSQIQLKLIELKAIPASDFKANIKKIESIIALGHEDAALKLKLRSYKNKLAAKIKEERAPKWSTFASKDEMSGDVSFYSSSPTISPTKRMSFPYSDITSFIGIGCSNNKYWIYAGFSSAPNITNDSTEDGYNRSVSRIRFDKQKPTNTVLTQDWGERFMHFKDDIYILEKLKSSSMFMLEVSWHGQGDVIFEYPLKGSTSAIEKMMIDCKVKA